VAVTQPGHAPLIVINVYNPSPSYSSIDKLSTILTNPLRQHNSPTILLGDFNLHNDIWNPPNYNINDAKSDDLIEICVDAGLSIRSELGVATYVGIAETTIDLVFSDEKADDVIISCQTQMRADMDFLSDHLAIRIDFDFDIVPLPEAQPGFHWDKADWDNINTQFGDTIAQWQCPEPTPESIDVTARQLVDIISKICEDNIPRSKHIPYSKRWWSDDLKKLRKTANRERRTWRQARTDESESKWKDARTTYNRALRHQKRLHFNRYLEEIGPNDLYRAAKICRRGRETELGTPPIQHENGVANTPQDKAQIFHEAFCIPTAPYDDSDIATADYPLPATNIVLTIEAFDDAVKRLSPDKAPGLSGVKGRAIKELWNKLRSPFFALCHTSFEIGHYPEPFKRLITAILRKPHRPSYE
jgi:hypothetical protein